MSIGTRPVPGSGSRRRTIGGTRWEYRVNGRGGARVVLWITAVVAGVLLAASPALAGGVRVRYPPTPGGGGLNGVQCFGGIGSCLAVGGGSKGVLVDRLTGSSWSEVPIRGPGLRGTATLNSVSCTGARSCVAVGGTGCRGPLAEVWNGRVWSVADAGLPACGFRTLRSVSCASGSACLAVGGACPGHTPGCSPGEVAGGVVERWDGRSWSAITYNSPNPVSLLGVSCPVRDGCAVVGQDSSAESVVGWWNGSRLSFLGLGDFQNNPEGPGAAMNGVSCTSVHFCEAVGFSWGSEGEAITWNGHSWGPLTGLPLLTDIERSAVSCVAAGDCVALGQSDPNIFPRFSAGRWESAAHDPGVGGFNSANAVWCGSLASCVTVGVHQDDNADDLGPMAAAGNL
jgi:hypothetical protein